MSGQRYHPTDQRYAPSDDTRFPPRERSPPRYGGDRFPAGNSYRPGYQNRPDDARDSTTSSVSSRDVPRGPKASFDAPRGGATFASAAPRGRGFSARGDYRPPLRGGDAPRDARDPPAAWTEERDRSWRDRELDRRDRRPSSPTRSRQTDFRDFREPPPPPASRDAEFGRRPSLRDQPSSALPAYAPRREVPPARGRGFLNRGRGRGDWDVRGHERDQYIGDKPFQSRSRSPREYRPDREIQRNRDNLDTRDERRFDGRDDRFAERADRERSYERMNKERSPFRNDSRRASVSSTSPSSPRPLSPALGQSGTGRPFNESNRIPSSLRRGSIHNQSAERWEDRRDPYGTESQDSKDHQDSRASSPPPAVDVPAFGAWNIWNAPTEPKAMKQHVTVPPNAPTGPKLTAPTGPKSDRAADDVLTAERRSASKIELREQLAPPPRTPGSVHPQRLNRLHGQAGATSPPASPTFVAPSGPRASASASGSPQILGANIPTGPKIDRGSQQMPRWASTAPVGPARQWQRSGSLGQAVKSTAIVPAKRDFNEEKKHDTPDYSAIVDIKHNEAQRITTGNASHVVDVNAINRPAYSTWGEKLESSFANVDPMETDNQVDLAAHPSAHPSNPDGVPGLMELDEDDFEKKEMQFQKERSRLESEIIDLGSPQLRGSHILEQLARLSYISLFAPPVRRTPTLPPLTNEQVVFGTGQLLTPNAEGLSQNGVAVRRHFAETGPLPIDDSELQALPYLTQGPPTPLEDLDIYKQNSMRYGDIVASVEKVLRIDFEAKCDLERQREEWYGELYRPWMAHVEQIDKESKEETPMEEEPDPGPPLPILDAPAILPPTSESRRRGGVSEYDLERVLQESLATARCEETRRMKQELSAKIDHDKEAIENAVKDPNMRDQHDFIDKSRDITSMDAITRWNFEPPPDIVSDQDHELMVKHFREYPKKWGKIAQSIREDGGAELSYKDCINHYYATKWNQEYKERRDKRRNKAKIGRVRGQGKPKANALISNLGDVRAELYEGDDYGTPNVAVTDSGRPRRAAAPTFGEKEAEELLQPTATVARRGAKGSEPPSGNGEKPVARRSRGSTKERGGRKPRVQSSMRARSTSPEKMELDNAKRVPLDAKTSLGNLRGQFDANGALGAPNAAGQASTIIPHPANASGAPVSEPAATVATNGDDAATQPLTQSSRSGPSSYWSVQEVGSFPAYLAHYGTDWHSIAQQMDTKTSTMVKNYYFRLISHNNRPDLEELARQADQKKERGEPVGPIQPPAIPSKKRGEASHAAAPRQLAPNAETTDGKGASPPYRASTTSQQNTGDPRALQSYGPVSQRPSLHGLSKPGPDVRIDGSEQSYMQVRRNEPLSRQPHSTSQQGSLSQNPRALADYDTQGRPVASSNVQHYAGHHFTEGPIPSSQPPPVGTSSRYYQPSPKNHHVQLSRDVGGQRAPYTDIKGAEERQYANLMDPPTRRPPYSNQSGQASQASTQQMSPTSRYGEIRPTHPPSPAREPPRAYPTSSQPQTQGGASSQPPPTRSEPRKMSSLAAILNADDEGPRRPANTAQSQPIQHRTATPPLQQYPSRPSSRPTSGLQSSELERSLSAYPRSVPTQTSGPSPRPYLETHTRDHQPSNQGFARPEWQDPSSFAPVTGSSQSGQRGTILERAVASPPADYHRGSLHTLHHRHGPSPPPSSLGFGHPPPLAQQQGHEVQAHSSMSQQSNNFSRTSGHASSLMHQNQQAFGRNTTLGLPAQQPGQPQRQSAFEPTSGRSEPDYSFRQDPLARLKEGQISRERDSQTRSNLRPDSFLMHGSGSYRQGSHPFKQPAQQRYHEHERAGPQYPPVQEDTRSAMSPRQSQVYPGSGQKDSSHGRG